MCIIFIFYSIITWDKITNDLHSTSGIVEKHLCAIYESIRKSYSELQMIERMHGSESETEQISTLQNII